MSYSVLQRVEAVMCDACGVRAVPIRPVGEWDPDFEAFLDAIARMGWTTWVGRARRHYCPDCGPKRGHTMRQITRVGVSQ